MKKNQVDPNSVQSALDEKAAREAFAKEYQALCAKHKYQLGARGYLQQVEGTVFKVMAVIEVISIVPAMPEKNE